MRNHKIPALVYWDKHLLFSDLRWNLLLFSELAWNISAFSKELLVTSCSFHFGVTMEFSSAASHSGDSFHQNSGPAMGHGGEFDEPQRKPLELIFLSFDWTGRLLPLVDFRVPPLLSSFPRRPPPFREASSRFMYAHCSRHSALGKGRESTSGTVHLYWLLGSSVQKIGSFETLMVDICWLFHPNSFN